jgi:hypothetical protein
LARTGAGVKEYTVERFERVYNDSDGWCYEIRPDTGGCDGVEIRYSEDGEKWKSLTMMPSDCAVLLAKSILNVAAHIEHRLQQEATP